MNWELVTALPPGGASRTLLGRSGRLFAVLRELDAEPSTDACTLPPAVLTLREVTTVAAQRYAVYDAVLGACLREVLEAHAELELPVPVGLAVRAVLDAARAVAAITPPRPHGGLSDSSVLLGFDGAVQVIDFGAARLNRFAPAGRPSAANDVFALGAVLHSALTGHGGHYGDSIAHGLTLPPPSQLNGEVPLVLDEVVMRALARDPSSRQTDADQLADELEAVLADDFGSAAMADALAQVLPQRLRVLEEILAGGAAVADTSPSLGVASTVNLDGAATLGDAHDEKTGHHLVPWVTGQTRDALAAVPAPERAPARVPLKTTPAWPSIDLRLGAEGTALGSAEVLVPTVKREALGEAADDATHRRPALDEPPALEEASQPTRVSRAPTEAPTPLSLAEADVPATQPRARVPDLTTLETVQKLEPVGPRNTSESERALAHGQERVATPPLGMAQTDPDEPVLEVLEVPGRSRGPLLVVTSLVVVAGLVLVKLLSPAAQTPSPTPAGTPKVVETVVDAAVPANAVGPPEPADAAVMTEADAGAPVQPVVDAGAPEPARKPAPKKPGPVKKKPAPKKKR